MPFNTGDRILRQVVSRLPVALEKEAAMLEERHKTAPEAAHRFIGIGAEVVRVMLHMVLPHMLERLTPSGSKRAPPGK